MLKPTSHQSVTCRTLAAAGAALCFQTGARALPPRWSAPLLPGSPREQSALVKSSGATVVDGARHAETGQFWVYAFPVYPGARCHLLLVLEDASAEPTVQPLDSKGIPTAVLQDRAPDGSPRWSWTAPNVWTPGAKMMVRISARSVAVNVKSVQFVQDEPDIEGLPAPVALEMLKGSAAGSRIVLLPAPARPQTVMTASGAVTRDADLQAGVVVLKSTDAPAVPAWKSRGYRVWLQTDLFPPLVAGPDSTAAPPPLPAGADGVLVTNNWLPIVPAASGTGATTASQSDAGSRWRAASGLADTTASAVTALFQQLQDRAAPADRVAGLGGPLAGALAGRVEPSGTVASLALTQGIVSPDPSPVSGRTLKLAGTSDLHRFAIDYLAYSSVAQMVAGGARGAWLSVDTPPASATQADRDAYQEEIVAAFLTQGAPGFKITAAPAATDARLSNESETLQDTLLAAAESTAGQSGEPQGARSGIGILVSDTLQWQAAPGSGSPDSLFGLALPLLLRGVPVQCVPFEKTVESNYLRQFKTLILSYDYQKPPSARSQEALVEWMRSGGSLIFFGGGDAFDNAPGAWWTASGAAAPEELLWQSTGGPSSRPATVRAPAEDVSQNALLRPAAPAGQAASGTVDLSGVVSPAGSVTVRFAGTNVSDPQQSSLYSLDLSINGRLAASFRTGTELEGRFLAYDQGSIFNGLSRSAPGSGSWTYQFDNLPAGAKVLLTLTGGSALNIYGAPAQPNYGRTLIATADAGPLKKAFPRLRIPAAYTITAYPGAQAARGAASPLYALRSGEMPGWIEQVGQGLAIDVGVPAAFFSATERAGSWLRALVQYAQQRAGGAYSEPGYLQLRRGRVVAVKTYGQPCTVPGRTIDLFSPTLAVTVGRKIVPRSSALLFDLGSGGAAPHLGLVSGRLEARVETQDVTSFFVRGASGHTGIARVHAGSRRLTGAVAVDRDGRRVPLDTTTDGGTILVHFPQDPDGVVVRMAWN